MVSCRRSASAAALPSAGGENAGLGGGLPPVGAVAGVGSGGASAALSCNGFEQLAAVAYRRHADGLEIMGRQLRQHSPIDFVIAEDGLVSLETQTA